MVETFSNEDVTPQVGGLILYQEITALFHKKVEVMRGSVYAILPGPILILVF